MMHNALIEEKKNAVMFQTNHAAFFKIPVTIQPGNRGILRWQDCS